MKTCPKCKTEYSDDKKFCKACRVQLISITAEKEPSLNVPSMDQEPKGELKPATHPTITKSNFQIKYIIAGVVSVVVVGIIILFLFSGKTNTSRTLAIIQTPHRQDVVVSNEYAVGNWTGNFGGRQILIVIEKNENGFASGYNILNGKKRSISGTIGYKDQQYFTVSGVCQRTGFEIFCKGDWEYGV